MKLSEIAAKLKLSFEGDDENIKAASDFKDYRYPGITYVERIKKKDRIPDKLIAVTQKELINEFGLKGSFIISPFPRLDFAKVLDLIYADGEFKEYVSQKTSIGKNASIEKPCFISDFCCLGEGVKIKKNTRIFPFVAIGKNCVIGENCVIYPGVKIYDGAQIGDNVILHSNCVIGSDGFGYVWDGKRHKKIKQVGNVEIGDNAEIGAGTTIDRGAIGKTIIGQGVKIDNLVHIAHNVKIGDNTVITAQVGISGSVEIGKSCVFGGQTGVAGHIKIGDNVIFAAKSGVSGSVDGNQTVSGFPVKPHSREKKIKAVISNLPEIYGRLKKLEKEVYKKNQE